MNRFIAILLISIPVVSNANCYTIVNNSNGIFKANIKYNIPILNGIVAIEIKPGARYPATGDHKWCFNTDSSHFARVEIVQAPNGAKYSWSGQLILGNGGSAHPSGTYKISN